MSKYVTVEGFVNIGKFYTNAIQLKDASREEIKKMLEGKNVDADKVYEEIQAYHKPAKAAPETVKDSEPEKAPTNGKGKVLQHQSAKQGASDSQADAKADE